jgi:aspartate aminotransferase-like enzyme
VDKFHAENTYLICLEENKLVGMLAARGNRPFSLDQKLPELDTLLPAGRSVVEVRLLAIDRKHRGARGGQVLSGLLALLWQHGIERGYDLAIISGTTRQLRLYQHLGFVPFGPVVGTGEAQFQPMYIKLETFEVTAREFLRAAPAKSFHASAVNFLPGPVTVRREVRRAFEQAPESHRCDAFKNDFAATQRVLCELTGARHVELLAGSGTLANDVVGAHLALVPGRGLVLSNGEFGARLADHARRFELDFELLEFPWGEALDLDAVRQRFAGPKAPAWVWCAHCETSSGVLNDVPTIAELCDRHGAKLALDCISSLGAVPVDLRGAYLATGASGKGLRSYPGVALVFYNHDLNPPAAPLPRYFDLNYYASASGIPFTFSSNLLHALHAAIKHVDWTARFQGVAKMSATLRSRLADLGVTLVGQGTPTAPAVVTIALPAGINSTDFGRRMQDAGFLLSCHSEYLRRRNWVQICLLGECTMEKTVALANAWRRVWSRQPVPTPPQPA